MAFKQDMDRFIGKVTRLEHQLFMNCVFHAERSIKFGSAVTGAPGQPVDKERLRPSYRRIRHGVRQYSISSDLPYAPIIEDNRRGAQLRSKVGGFHSIKMTRIGWRRIVAFEAAKLKTTSMNIPVGRTMGRDASGRFTGNAAQLDIG